MISLPEKLQNLSDYLSKIPGVGQKTAFRYLMNILKWSEAERQEFAQSLEQLSEVYECEKCGTYSDEALCCICQDETRQEAQTICVVEQFTDLLAIENSGKYQGEFHILGGVLNPLAGIGPDQLRISQLLQRAENRENLTLILAMNPSVEGDATCSFLKEILPDYVKVERIGFGVPIGGSLEYLDPMTITKALENKRLL